MKQIITNIILILSFIIFIICSWKFELISLQYSYDNSEIRTDYKICHVIEKEVIVNDDYTSSVSSYKNEKDTTYIFILVKIAILILLINLIAYLLVNRKNKIIISLLFIITVIYHKIILFYTKYLVPESTKSYVYIKNIQIPLILVWLFVIISTGIMVSILYKCIMSSKKSEYSIISFKPSIIILLSILVLIIGNNSLNLINIQYNETNYTFSRDVAPPKRVQSNQPEYYLKYYKNNLLCYVYTQTYYIDYNYQGDIEFKDIVYNEINEKVKNSDDLIIKHFCKDNLIKYMNSVFALFSVILLLNIVAYLIVNKKVKILSTLVAIMLFIIATFIHKITLYSDYGQSYKHAVVYLKELRLPEFLPILVIILINIIITCILCNYKQKKALQDNSINLISDKLKITDIQ